MPTAIEVADPNYLIGAREIMLPYAPWPRQNQFHSSPAKFRLFGGSAGPGKSLALCMEGCLIANEWSRVNTLLLRRTFPELERGMIRYFLERVPRELYYSYNATNHTVTWLNNSVTVFGSCQHKNSIYNYQGTENVFVGWDELTQFLFAEWTALKPWNRCPVEGSFACMAGATNPLGVGLPWVKKLWVDKLPYGDMDSVQKSEYMKERGQYEFVGATYLDNPIYANDSNFISNLESLPKALREALKLGLWTAIAGSYFADVWDREVHIVPQVDYLASKKEWWPKWISIDWGFAHPSAVYWHTQAGAKTITYREFVKNRLSAPDLAREIIERSKGENIFDIYLSPDAFADRDAHQSVAEQLGEEFRKADVPLPWPEPANDDRVGGAVLLYKLLQGKTAFITDSCECLIETLPMIIHDPDHVEDTLKIDGDDAYDSWRYGVYSRLSPRKAPREEQVRARLDEHPELDPTSQALFIRKTLAEMSKGEAPLRFRRGRG